MLRPDERPKLERPELEPKLDRDELDPKLERLGDRPTDRHVWRQGIEWVLEEQLEAAKTSMV